MLAYVLLMSAIAAEDLATILLKRAAGSGGLLTGTGVVIFYAASFVLLGLVFKQGMPMTIAYAIWAAVGVTSIAAIGVFFLHERLTGIQIAGIALITVGVAALELGASVKSAR